MKRIACAWLVLWLAGCTVSYSPTPQGGAPKSTRGTDGQRAEAVDAARFYLGLIDAGDTEKTWTLAAPALRVTTNHFMWTNAIKLAKKVDATPRERAIDGVGFTTQLEPGTPAGEYAIVQFASTSDNTRTSERVVLQKERARWKIAGYFVTKKAMWKSKS